MTVRPTADARWEVIVEVADGISAFGPFSDASDVEGALHKGLALLLPRPNAPTSSPAR
jgi:hypothetical protein